MIKSQLVLDILDLALDHEKETEKLKNQIPYLTEKEYEFTGVGVYIYFDQDPKIFMFTANFPYEGNVLENGNIAYRLNGIEIRNDKEKFLADATVHLINGIINCVEILNKIGVYPTKEPDNYAIYQIWIDEDKRRTIIRPYKKIQ